MRILLAQLLFSLVIAAAPTSSAALAEVQSAKPEGTLVAPHEVVLYVHSELRNTGFIEPLICALERVLVAPVYVKKIDFALGPEMLASGTQFDVEKVANRFLRATSDDGGPRTFKYLLLGRDLKGAPYRYVFATSFGNQTTNFHMGVVSTARLDVRTSRHERAAELLAARSYKLILKSIARVAGYSKSDGCILAFPRDLAELDKKSPEFCADDRAALVSAGILKSKEGGGCAAIAETARYNLLAVVARAAP